MDQIIRIKFSRRFLVLMAFLAFFFLFSGCSRALRDKNNNPTTGQTSETIQSSQISTTPTPTPLENRVFEQIDVKSLLTVVEGKDNVIVVGKDQTFEIQGVLDSADYTIDSSKVVMLFDRSENGTGRLVLCDGTEAKDIATDVSAFRISNDGSTLAFLTGVYSEGVGCDLYIYDCASGETNLIAESAGWQFALSPNGKAIAYTVFDDPENVNSWSCVLWMENNDQGEFARDMIPAALTDDGSIVYAINDSDSTDASTKNELWAVTDNERVLLGYLFEEQGKSIDIYFNQDFSQVLFDGVSGIYFSKNGEKAECVDQGVFIEGYSACKRQCVISEDADSCWFWINNSCTENLFNVFMKVRQANVNEYNIWYFTEELNAITLTAVSEIKPFRIHKESILAYDDQSEEMIYVKDIFSPQYYSEYDASQEIRISCPSLWQFLQTNSGMLYYCNSYSTNVLPFVLHRIFLGGDDSEVEISTECVWFWYLDRENEPGLIYYLEYGENNTSEGESSYIYDYYYDLYCLEDATDAIPHKIAENVCEAGIGDYGIYYLQLEQISPDLSQVYNGELNIDGEGNIILDLDLYDQNKVFYSIDGVTFECVAEVGIRHIFGG